MKNALFVEKICFYVDVLKSVINWADYVNILFLTQRYNIGCTTTICGSIIK